MNFTRYLQWLNDQPDEKKYERYLRLAGHLYFLIMLALSIIFFKERMLSIDTANYAFNLIYNQHYYTGHGRFITYATQVLPLWTLKSGASLQTILIAYSASFILFYYLIYNIIIYLFRNVYAGIFLALSLGLSLRYKFYGPVGEVVISMAILALLVGWITKDKGRFARIPPWLDMLIGGALGLCLLFGHPFIVVSTVIFLGFDVVYHHKWKDTYNWGVILITGLGFAWRLVFTPGDAYENKRAGRIGETFEVLANWQEYPVFRHIYHYFDSEYALPFAAFLLVVILLFWERKWLSGLYIFAAFLGVLTLVIVTHSYLGEAPIFIMIDGYLAHLGLVWAIPIAFFLLKKQKIWPVLIVVLLLGFSLDRIANKRKFFTERVQYLENIIEVHRASGQHKLLAKMDDFSWQKLWMPWAVGVETLLISSLDGPTETATLYYLQPNENADAYLDDPNLFLSVHYAATYFKAANLPKHLFGLPEERYQRIAVEK